MNRSPRARRSSFLLHWLRLGVWSLVLPWSLVIGPWSFAPTAFGAPRPNVVLIMTDDQGYGDLGFHGNPHVRTPHLDTLARQSVRFKYFYVSPVCSPTRASLMTGRYNYRTGVVDTFLGRSMMHPEEVTVAEMFGRAGYQTGIFGKWHLGDNYPMRPGDQGFQESLVHGGGGLAQPADPPGGNSYFDPVLKRNGKDVKTRGYCTDVFTDAALAFIDQNRSNPFFVYIPYNAPHTPLQVPTNYLDRYKTVDFTQGGYGPQGHPLPPKIDHDTTARVYAMVENIDDNVGRLMAKLDALGLAENTIVIFLTDNGPQQPRYTSGLFQRKGSVHEGGIRVPFFIRWTGTIDAGKELGIIAANIDVAPTLLQLCGVAKPSEVTFDGLSLVPLLRAVPGEKLSWPDRTLFFQWHRGDEPQPYRAFAARSQRYKLVQPAGVQDPFDSLPPFKLYDMAADPFETKDLAFEKPDVVEQMRLEYAAWFRDVSNTRGYAPPRIHVGAAEENPVVLSRQDWRGPKANWGADGIGHWEIFVTRAGAHEIRLQFPEAKANGEAHVAIAGVTASARVKAGENACKLAGLKLPAGPARLEAWLVQGREQLGVHHVTVRR
jgi:arylsulfatase A-like enzyme